MKGMGRKDIILITVLINAGLLAILFATAIIYDIDKVEESIPMAVVSEPQFPTPIEAPPQLIASHSTMDEMDQLLTSYTPSSPDVQSEFSVQGLAFTPVDDKEDPQEEWIEVTVKRGDTLDKIARLHGTTIAEIKKINRLASERLQIGQVLKVPKKKEEVPKPLSSAEAAQQPSEAVYYVVKSGDNPWKIAKQFQVDYADILRLNHLDEEKARNLRVGDRIRIK